MTVVLAAAALLALALYYRWRVARPPELVYQHAEKAQAASGGTGGERGHQPRSRLIAHLLRACPTLTEPFRPPLWAFNRHLQLALLAWRDRQTGPLQFDRTETFTLADGGTVSLEWLGLADPALGPTTPTIVILPTICGDGQSLRRTVQGLRRRLGWRVVVCNRRGHGTLPLTSPRFSTLGATDDVRAQLARVRAELPASPLYGLGISAGSGLLVRYLGEEGARTPLSAGIAYCPGYDTTRAFHRIHRVYDRYLIGAVRQYFVERHAEVLRDRPGYADILASRTVGEFHDRQHAFAGFSSLDEFHRHTNPMMVAAGIAVPFLTLNAADDPICTLANVEEHRDLFAHVADSLLVLTARGSHCAFLEGHWRPRSWAHRLISEYFGAVEAARSPALAAPNR